MSRRQADGLFVAVSCCSHCTSFAANMLVLLSTFLTFMLETFKGFTFFHFSQLWCCRRCRTPLCHPAFAARSGSCSAQAAVRRAAQRYCQPELILIKPVVQGCRIIR